MFSFSDVFVAAGSSVAAADEERVPVKRARFVSEPSVRLVPPRSSVSKTKPRRSRPGCEIQPHSFRPPVAAEDRLHVWTSPLSLRLDAALAAELSTLLANKVQAAVISAFEPATRRSYGAGLLRFHQFCDREGVSEHRRLPASSLLLAGFVAHSIGTVSGATVRLWMSGLRAWHDVNGAPWEGGDRYVQLVKISAAKLAPTSSKRAKRHPVTLEHLLVLEQALDPANSMDCAIWAVATLAFWGCCRLGELILPSSRAFDPRRHVARSASIQYRCLRDGSTSAHFHIPFAKVEKEAGADLSFVSRSALCPVSALRRHIASSRDIPSAAPLFAFRVVHGGWAPLTWPWFMDRCSKIWAAHNLSTVSGHSFRIGGATELLLAGVPPETVAAQGRWKSLAFLLYWRKLEELIPLTISKSYDKSRISDLSAALEQFRVRHRIPAAIPPFDDSPL